jgi:hypothetical protein
MNSKVIELGKRTINSMIFIWLSLLLSIYIIGHKSDLEYGWTNPENRSETVLKSDGFAYYSFLPQYFIYSNQKQYTFLDSLKNTDPLLQVDWMIYPTQAFNYKINKYYVGTALAMAPFFTINHFYQLISGGKTDGYSFSYRLALFLGAMTYLFLAFVAIIKLSHLYNIPNSIILLGIIILLFGTNLSHYASHDFALSHIYAFTACAWFLFFSKKWAIENKKKYLYLLSFSLGFLVLIRPVDGIILLLLPFLFENWKEFIFRLKSLFTLKHFPIFLISVLIFISFISLQLYSNYIQFGSLKLYSYENEGFDFIFQPKIKEVLFGYAKGFFVYVPVMLLLIPSFIILFFSKRHLTLGSVFVFMVFVWITASWWCWYYGGSFGMRPLVDYYPLFILIILLAFKVMNRYLKFIFLLIMVFGIYLYQILEYQYMNKILHWQSMNKEIFWHVFMEKDTRFEWYPHIILENEHLPKDKKPSFSKSFIYFDNIWESSTSAKYSILDNQSIFHYSLLKKQENRILGFYITGKGKIENGNDLNNAEIFYFKNGDTISRKVGYIGSQMKKLNHFEDFIVQFYNPNIKQSDSIQIHFRKFDKGRSLKDLRIKINYYD